MARYGTFQDRAADSLRAYYQAGGTATPAQRLIWSRDVAQTTHFLHQHGIRHADLSGRNLLLTPGGVIMLCEFGGASIDHRNAYCIAEAGYRHPDTKEATPPTIRGEIHSLGSVIYEIMTGHKPHAGLEDSIVHQMIEQGRYPDLHNVLLAGVIAGCLKGEFYSAAEVFDKIVLSGLFAPYYREP